MVLECSGAFADRATAQQHIDSGAKRVLFSQPAESNVDATIVYGINQHILTGDETIISSASCSTNCVVPVIKYSMITLVLMAVLSPPFTRR